MKTIKISEENYRWLLNIAAELQKRRGQIITFDIALSEIKKKKKEGAKVAISRKAEEYAYQEIKDKMERIRNVHRS